MDSTASRRPAITTAYDAPSSSPNARRPRIHPVLYGVALISSFILCVFFVSELAGYAPPSMHTPGRHDELFASPQSGSRSDPASSMSATSNWNSIANALGGFSTSSIYSPELNASWIARPAGFGPRLLGDSGLSGTLHSIGKHSIPGGDPLKTSRGCRVDLDTRLGQSLNIADTASIALIERGDCPFITKLLNAQALRYNAVIIFNDRGSSEYSEEDDLLSMWSPSREARLLTIPSVFVSRATGKSLESLIAAAEEHRRGFVVEIQPEEPPHLFLLDAIIMLFFLPTIFTTVVLILTRVRQLRHRAAQRAPKALVDSLPSFMWREGIEHDIEALDLGEKDRLHSAGTTGESSDEGDAGSAGITTDGSPSKSGSRLASLLSKAFSRPSQSEERSISTQKAKHLARKIFAQKECAICLCDFVSDERVKLLPCGHLYHEAEINSWLTEQKRWCPVCRSPIDGDEEQAIQSGETTSPSLPSTALAEAQPIVQPEDLEGEDFQPVASSSTASERTPLISGGRSS